MNIPSELIREIYSQTNPETIVRASLASKSLPAIFDKAGIWLKYFETHSTYQPKSVMRIKDPNAREAAAKKRIIQHAVVAANLRRLTPSSTRIVDNFDNLEVLDSESPFSGKKFTCEAGHSLTDGENIVFWANQIPNMDSNIFIRIGKTLAGTSTADIGKIPEPFVSDEKRLMNMYEFTTVNSLGHQRRIPDSADGTKTKKFYSAFSTGRQIWDMAELSCLANLHPFDGAYLWVTNKDDRVVIRYDNQVFVWDSQAKQLIKQLKFSERAQEAILFNQDLYVIAKGSLYHHDLKSEGTEITLLHQTEYLIFSMMLKEQKLFLKIPNKVIIFDLQNRSAITLTDENPISSTDHMKFTRENLICVQEDQLVAYSLKDLSITHKISFDGVYGVYNSIFANKLLIWKKHEDSGSCLIIHDIDHKISYPPRHFPEMNLPHLATIESSDDFLMITYSPYPDMNEKTLIIDLATGDSVHEQTYEKRSKCKFSFVKGKLIKSSITDGDLESRKVKTGRFQGVDIFQEQISRVLKVAFEISDFRPKQNP